MRSMCNFALSRRNDRVADQVLKVCLLQLIIVWAHGKWTDIGSQLQYLLYRHLQHDLRVQICGMYRFEYRRRKVIHLLAFMPHPMRVADPIPLARLYPLYHSNKILGGLFGKSEPKDRYCVGNTQDFVADRDFTATKAKDMICSQHVLYYTILLSSAHCHGSHP
jgi:hypothetical protein